MITIEAALGDVDKLISEAEKNNDKATSLVLRGYKVVLKFLSTMRTNQLLTEPDKVAIKKAREKRTKEKQEEK